MGYRLVPKDIEYTAGVPATTTTISEVDMGPGVAACELVAFRFRRTAGDGTTYTPTMGEVTAYTASEFDEVMTYSAIAVATKTWDRFSVPIPMKPDENGKLYFRPGFDGGINNVAKARFWFRITADRA